MAVYVDELVTHHQKAKSGGRYFGSGKASCHMTADSREELDAMARRIGLRTIYIQDAGTWKEHYDLTEPKRAAALRAGAIFKGAREQARERVAKMREAQIIREQSVFDATLEDNLPEPNKQALDKRP